MKRIIYEGRRIYLSLLQELISHNTIFKSQYQRNNNDLIETMKPILANFSGILGYFIKYQDNELIDVYFIDGKEREKPELSIDYYAEKRKGAFILIDLFDANVNEVLLNKIVSKLKKVIYEYYSDKNQTFDILSFFDNLELVDHIITFNMPVPKSKKKLIDTDFIGEKIEEKVDFLYPSDKEKTKAKFTFRYLGEKIKKITDENEFFTFISEVVDKAVGKKVRYLIITNLFQNKSYSVNFASFIADTYYKRTAKSVIERIRSYREDETTTNLEAVSLFILTTKFLPEEYSIVYAGIDTENEAVNEIINDISAVLDSQNYIILFPETEVEKIAILDNVKNEIYDKKKAFFTNDMEILIALHEKGYKAIFLNRGGKSYE